MTKNKMERNPALLRRGWAVSEPYLTEMGLLDAIRVFPTSRAVGRLKAAGNILLSQGKVLRLRGRLTAGRYAKILRQIGNPELIREIGLHNCAINLDRIKDPSDLLKPGVLSHTRWLVEKIKKAGGSFSLASFLAQYSLSRAKLEDLIALELSRNLSGVAEQTLEAGSRQKAAQVVKKAAADFITLANLSNKGDEEFVNFILSTLMRAGSKHNRGVSIHLGAVAFYAAAIAAEMGYPPRGKIFQRLKTAALLHDIGKIGITKDLLHEPRPNPYQVELLQEHLPITVYLLEEIRFLKNVVPIIQHHHDNLETYPAWLREGAAFEAKILEVADAFEAMTSERAYKLAGEYYQIRGKRRILKKRFTREEALEQLEKEEFPSTILEALKKVLARAEDLVYDLKEYFDKDELKLIRFGVEHLIKESILPLREKEEEVSLDSILARQRAWLWLVSGRRVRKQGAMEFVKGVKEEVHGAIKEAGLESKFSLLKRTAENELLLAQIYLCLFKAIKIDQKRRSNLLSKLMEIFSLKASNLSSLLRLMEDLLGKEESEEYLEWLSLALQGKDTSKVPKLGEEAFIQRLEAEFEQMGLSRFSFRF
jgi:putative nucleotidyltransferase with HDIG domain